MHNECFRYLVYIGMHILKDCVIFTLNLHACFQGTRTEYGWVLVHDIQTKGQFVSLIYPPQISSLKEYLKEFVLYNSTL